MIKILIPIFFLTLLAGCSPSDDTSGVDEFHQLARERFDNIESSFDEDETILNIECLNDKCDSVIYFNFSGGLPEDFETVMALNTASYSKFRQDNKGVSGVTLYMTYTADIMQDEADNLTRTLLECRGKDGEVQECNSR